MKGFLHRLAERAAGTSVEVRSDARLPYGGGLGWADPGAPEADLPAAAPARGTQAPVPAQDGVQRDEPAARRTADPLPQAAPPVQALRTPAVAMPGADGTSGPPAPAARPPDEADPTPRPQRADLSTRPAPAEAGALLAATATATVTDRVARQSGHSASRGPAPPAIEAPAPLMPRPDTRPAARSTPPLLPQGAARPRTAAGLPADDGHTEVHVHIGRIDVIAAHDAPPSPRRRAAATAPAPMSLDGYLAARQRGRS